MKNMRFPQDPKIISQEIVTDQSDPRMIEFRKKCREFEPGCLRKTVKLEIAKYTAKPNEFQIIEVIGYYEGDSSPYQEGLRMLARIIADQFFKSKKKPGNETII